MPLTGNGWQTVSSSHQAVQSPIQKGYHYWEKAGKYLKKIYEYLVRYRRLTEALQCYANRRLDGSRYNIIFGEELRLASQHAKL